MCALDYWVIGNVVKCVLIFSVKFDLTAKHGDAVHSCTICGEVQLI